MSIWTRELAAVRFPTVLKGIGVLAVLAVGGLGATGVANRDDAITSGTWTDPCVTAAAEPILTGMGLDGVTVLVADLPPSIAGRTDEPIPDTLVVDVTTAATCGHDDPRRSLAVTVAHEGAHLLQARLAGATTNPWLGVVIDNRVRDRIDELGLATGGDRDGIPATEVNATCVAEAAGYPEPLGGGYGGMCTEDDLHAARDVLDGRWPTAS